MSCGPKPGAIARRKRLQASPRAGNPCVHPTNRHRQSRRVELRVDLGSSGLASGFSADFAGSRAPIRGANGGPPRLGTSGGRASAFGRSGKGWAKRSRRVVERGRGRVRWAGLLDRVAGVVSRRARPGGGWAWSSGARPRTVRTRVRLGGFGAGTRGRGRVPRVRTGRTGGSGRSHPGPSGRSAGWFPGAFGGVRGRSPGRSRTSGRGRSRCPAPGERSRIPGEPGASGCPQARKSH